MKKLVWLLMALFVIIACKKEAVDYTVLTGKIDNAKEQKEIRIRGNNFSQTISLNEDGSFADTLRPITSGYYILQFGRQNVNLFLEQGDNLRIIADAANPKGEVIFEEGKTTAANQYLAEKKRIINDKIEKIGGFKAIYGMKEDAFLTTIDSLKKETMKIADAASNLSKEFIEMEKKDAEYTYLHNLSLYPQYHAYVSGNKDYKASDAFAKRLEAVDYSSNEDYTKYPTYKQLVMNHFVNEYYKEGADTKVIIDKVKGLGVKDLPKDFAGFLLSQISSGEKNMKERVSEIESLTDDVEVLKKLKEIAAQAEKLAEGKPSPTFNYESIEGKYVSLADLKGKLVYIDVWATWCGPCKGEIPFLQKLEKDYHRKPIHFVSLSVDEDRTAWEAMVKEKKLGGIQLIADKNWNSGFVREYGIKGIPRFILLDKEGAIISSNAPRPSSKEIRTMLDTYLKK